MRNVIALQDDARYTGWPRLIASPKLQIIFHKRATKYRALLLKMTYKDNGSYERYRVVKTYRIHQHTATCTATRTATHINTHCNSLASYTKHASIWAISEGLDCNALQQSLRHSATDCNNHYTTLQRTATIATPHWTTLHHTATYTA